MKAKILLIIIFCSILISIPFASLAEQKVEQKPGQPLYFDPEKYGGHESDLAPHTDPQWQQEKTRREQTGQPIEELYQEPQQVIREEKLYFRRVGDGEKDRKPPSRWDQ